jgi:hypothetical protein
MFIVLVVASAPCLRAARLLSAESEPMVPLSGMAAPQSLELPAAATPARADMVLQLRIYLDIRNKESAWKMYGLTMCQCEVPVCCVAVGDGGNGPP